MPTDIRTLATEAADAAARGRLYVHAGAVAHRGRALVIPGSSGWGKSTLTAALLAAGATYLTDDMAMMTIGDGDGSVRVHPRPQPLSIRPGWRLAPGPVSAASLDAPTATEPVPLGLMAVLVRDLDAPAVLSLELLTPGRASLALLSHAVAAREVPERCLELAGRAARSAPCWTGIRGDADLAARALLGLSETLQRSRLH